ncbi:hypothetical protein JHK82_054611 [Glycine max]|nr:hypothetical protein JHK82_054611 [Glycine max]
MNELMNTNIDMCMYVTYEIVTYATRTAAMVVGGVVHWFAMWGKLAIYDPRLGDRYIALIKLPTGVLTHEHEESVLGESSDGLLQYGQSNNLGGDMDT